MFQNRQLGPYSRAFLSTYVFLLVLPVLSPSCRLPTLSSSIPPSHCLNHIANNQGSIISETKQHASAAKLAFIGYVQLPISFGKQTLSCAETLPKPELIREQTKEQNKTMEPLFKPKEL